MDALHLKARESAIEARRRNDLNNLEPVDVYKIFSLLNISCIKKPMVDTSGAYLRLDNVKVIIINTANTLGHQNFTAAHEFYHAEFDTGLEGRACTTGKFDHKDENEMLADLFAAYFLMPEDGILHQLYKKVKNLNNVEINDIIFLEHLFGVSHKAMLVRLKQIGIINEQKMDSFLPNIRYNARLNRVLYYWARGKFSIAKILDVAVLAFSQIFYFDFSLAMWYIIYSRCTNNRVH